MSFASVLSLIKAIVQLVMKLPAMIDNFIKKQVKKDSSDRSSKVKEGTEDAKKAKSKEEKAEAACKIEKALDPSSTCDSKPSND